VAGAESAGFEAEPAVALGGAVFLEVEVGVFGFTEAGHGGVFFLDALEDVENGFALVREIEL